MKLADIQWGEGIATIAEVSQKLVRTPDHFDVHPSRAGEFPDVRYWHAWKNISGTYELMPSFGGAFDTIYCPDALTFACALLEFEEATDEHESTARP